MDRKAVDVDRDRSRKASERRRALFDMVSAWFSMGKKGKKPGKARLAKGEHHRSVGKRKRVARDRVRQEMTKRLQRARRARGQNARTGR